MDQRSSQTQPGVLLGVGRLQTPGTREVGYFTYALPHYRNNLTYGKQLSVSQQSYLLVPCYWTKYMRVP